MNISQLFRAHLPFRAFFRGILPSRSLERPSPEDQGSDLVECPPCYTKYLECHHFVVAAARAALELHIPHQRLHVGKNNVQHNTSPSLLLYILEKEVIINTLQEPLVLLMPCCAVPLTDTEVYEVPHED